MMRFVEDFIREEPSVDQITRVGMDTSKRFFQLHGVDASEQAALRRRLTRAQALPFFERLPATVVAMEACGAAHHWARELSRLGHAVRLIAPQPAKPYVARGKNDAADAAALCEAASRPQMRFVPAKSADEQAALMLAGQRERLVRQRTQLVNTIRGHGARSSASSPPKGRRGSDGSSSAWRGPTSRRWRAIFSPSWRRSMPRSARGSRRSTGGCATGATTTRCRGA
jgi:transposase